MSYRLHRTLATALILTLTGCATYPINPPLSQYNPKSGYRYENLTAPGNSESLFVILTFSGGGTRAAALSYGVLEKLRNTKIQWEGQQRRLLDEVDVISSVSGGSFTAAYYGLFREELFDPEKFEKAFLYRNIQGELIASLFNPINWFRLGSPGFGRIELAAELYDREIFRGKTFGDLINQGRRPYIMINATDITMGAQFTFVQDQFDPICSDLAGVPVSRAVAASSNFPIAFTPLIVDNYAGTCNYREPAWLEQALQDLLLNPPRFNRARIARSYLNSEARRYVHLLDGGVADNIGLRGQLLAIQSNDVSWSVINKINLKEIKKLVVIVVDARTNPQTDIDKNPGSPGLGTLIDTISSVPMSNYSFETVQQLLGTFESWRREKSTYAACQTILQDQCPAGKMRTPPPYVADSFAIYVGFDQIKDEKERQDLLNLPTTFGLPKGEVDKLRRVGPKILEESETYQELCAELKCRD
jgi:NTE family protein